jgi:bleomycin hydrolase
MKATIFSTLVICFLFTSLWAQKVTKDRAMFVEPTNEFYDQIKSELKDFYDQKEPEKKKFKMDFTGLDLPQDIKEFTYQWHNEPISQGRTGTCWSFCTTSFYESEIFRQSGVKVKLSEMYTVYWEYVEKARRFVQERGDSHFAQGSMANAVSRIWKKYGIVPTEEYPGIPEGQPFLDHRKMYGEMKEYLQSVKEMNMWNEIDVQANIKSILNYYMGEPPLKISYNGKNITPLEYLENVLKLNLDDYVDLMSLKEAPYFKNVEYPVPDNWWHSEDYYNVPLDLFMEAINESIRRGYTVNIGGDVSESGYDSHFEVALVPTFDIPSEYIDENSRQFRFSNKATTDDHGIHIVGYKKHNGDNWYLIKDSGSGAFNGKNKGYRFYHEDYIKLKIMDITIHRDIAKEVFKDTNE